jgi:hypothetical protein
MSTDALALPRTELVSRPIVARLHDWVTTVDHKRLGILYIIYALVFLLIAGVEAIIIRIQLIRPHNDFVSPQVFNRMFTMHGTTMIFFMVMPVLFGFANYLIPLMIGAPDMAFPRLNAFSFWMTAFGGLLLYFSLVGANGLYGAGNAPDVGWFAYAPLTSQTFSVGHSTDFWTLALLVSGVTRLIEFWITNGTGGSSSSPSAGCLLKFWSLCSRHGVSIALRSLPLAGMASSNSPQQSLCCGGSAQARHARPRKAGLLGSRALCCLCSLPVWSSCQR